MTEDRVVFTMTNYVTVGSLEEAYALLGKNKSNKILGGTLWMRMGSQTIHTGIDLSQLGLDQIVENEEAIEIGAMCSLRMIETHPLMNEYFSGIVAESVKDIVGVQFRNCATIGGSIYSRFGFSDILTALLALDTYVELYHGGILSLEDFIKTPYEKDILVKIIIKKEQIKGAYQTDRLSHTDFPVLAVAVTKGQKGYKISVGARPSKAALAYEAMHYLNTRDELGEEMIESAVHKVIEELNFGSNMRASETYRKHLAKVLIKRSLKTLSY